MARKKFDAMHPPHIYKNIKREKQFNEKDVVPFFPEFAKNSDDMPGPDFSSIEIEKEHKKLIEEHEKLEKQLQGMQDLNKDLEVQAKEIIAENEKLKAQLEKGNKKELLDQIKELEDKVAELELELEAVQGAPEDESEESLILDDNVEHEPVEQEDEGQADQEEDDADSPEE
ncbi:MAG: hypothetical protein PVG39_02710 [Desulfobacteraceae bacterium]|jgi:hypothetical protein